MLVIPLKLLKTIDATVDILYTEVIKLKILRALETK